MDSLKDRVAALERTLRMRPTASKSGRRKTTLAGEIEELERRLNAMSYMDDEIVDEDVVVDDDVEMGMDEEVDVEMGMDDELEMGMDEEIVDDEEFVEDDEDFEDEDFCAGPKFGSEDKPGVEDEITQEYLSEVQGEAHGDELTTDDSMLDAAPTEYVARLHRASKRLDRVANYLEKQGRTALAKRIDTISDAIDARAKKASRRA